MKRPVERLLHQVIISCQAFPGDPFYGSDYMKKMAESAIQGGAGGLRACWAQDIKAIRSVTDLPIVGIHKALQAGDPLDNVIITPTLDAASSILDAGADVVALDCTIRSSRGFDQLCELLLAIRTRYPQAAVMADLSRLEEARRVAETGMVDILSSTLAGYTRDTMDQMSDGPLTSLISAMKQATGLPVNGEGRIWELAQLRECLDAGADMLTIGTAVTRPHSITQRFVQCNQAYFQENRPSDPSEFAVATRQNIRN